MLELLLFGNTNIDDTARTHIRDIRLNVIRLAPILALGIRDLRLNVVSADRRNERASIRTLRLSVLRSTDI